MLREGAFSEYRVAVSRPVLNGNNEVDQLIH